VHRILDALTAAHWTTSDAGTVASVVLVLVLVFVVVVVVETGAAVVDDAGVVRGSVRLVVGTTVVEGAGVEVTVTTLGSVPAIVDGMTLVLLVLVVPSIATGVDSGRDGSVNDACSVGKGTDVTGVSDATDVVEVVAMLESLLPVTIRVCSFRIAGNAAATEAAASDATATATATPARRPRRIGPASPISTNAPSPKIRRSSASTKSLDGSGVGRAASRSSASFSVRRVSFMASFLIQNRQR
jgi:hypothetical protein